MTEFLNYLASLLWQFTDKFYANFINERRYESIAKGIGITIEVSFLAIGLGVLIGFAIAAMKLSNNKWLQRVANSYVSILRGTPVVTQLLIFNFVIFGSISLDKVFIAVIAFGVNSGAYVSEIMRAGILSIDHGQTEAGRSLGFNKREAMMYIIAPQAIKNIFPALGNEFIVLIKETAIVGYIGLVDLAKAGDFIRSRTLEAFFPLIATAVIYFTIVKILTKVLTSVEIKMRKADVR